MNHTTHAYRYCPHDHGEPVSTADDAIAHIDAAIAALDGKVFASCHGLWVRGVPVKGSRSLIAAKCPECDQRYEQNTDWPPTAA